MSRVTDERLRDLASRDYLVSSAAPALARELLAARERIHALEQAGLILVHAVETSEMPWSCEDEAKALGALLIGVTVPARDGAR
jgi:hypothetical protein